MADTATESSTARSAEEIHGELVTTERVALVVGRILLGERMTTREISEYVGIGWEGARLMMGRISRVLPIYQMGGAWQRGEIEWPY